MKKQYFLSIFASIALLSFDSVYSMETADSAETTSSEGTPRRARRVIIAGRKPTMKIGSQIFHFPQGIDPERDIVGAERSYIPSFRRQIEDEELTSTSHVIPTKTVRTQPLYDVNAQETDISSTKNTHRKTLKALLSRLFSCIH